MTTNILYCRIKTTKHYCRITTTYSPFNGGRELVEMENQFVEQETTEILREEQSIASMARVFDPMNQEQRIKILFTPDATALDKKHIKDIMSRNISMFQGDKSGSVRWLYFKKGTIEQWVFAIHELERRGYTSNPDKKTLQYTKQLFKKYQRS